MKLNTNKDRAVLWQELLNQYEGKEIEQAFESLKPETQMVLLMHYGEDHKFKDIAVLMQLPVSVIRHHHNRGIYKLYRHFNPQAIENIKRLISKA